MNELIFSLVLAVTFAWDYPAAGESQLSGFKLHWGPMSGKPSHHLDLPLVKTATLDNSELPFGVRIFFTVTAIDKGGSESAPSNEVSFTRTIENSLVNLVINPSFDQEAFDTQTPSGWNKWSNVSLSYGYTENRGGTHFGWRHYTHFGSEPYQFYTWQTIAGIPNGLYGLSAWVRCSGGQKWRFLEAKDYGGPKLIVNFPVTDTVTQISISDINVTKRQCTIGFYSDSPAGGWLTVDDVAFYRQLAP